MHELVNVAVWPRPSHRAVAKSRRQKVEFICSRANYSRTARPAVCSIETAINSPLRTSRYTYSTGARLIVEAHDSTGPTIGWGDHQVHTPALTFGKWVFACKQKPVRPAGLDSSERVRGGLICYGIEYGRWRIGWIVRQVQCDRAGHVRRGHRCTIQGCGGGVACVPIRHDRHSRGKQWHTRTLI